MFLLMFFLSQWDSVDKFKYMFETGTFFCKFSCQSFNYNIVTLH